MIQIAAIITNTFREAIRNRVLYSIVFFVAIILCVAAFFGSVSIGDKAQVIKDFGLFSLSFFGAILTIVTGVTLLNKELKQKTIYNILSKPVHRWQFVYGKHLGLTLTVCVLVALMGCGLVAFVACFESKIDFLLFQGILLALLEVMVLSSVVLFFSSLAVTTFLPGILTLATYFVGHSLHYLVHFFGGPEKAYARTIAETISWIVPNLHIFNANELIVYGSAVEPSRMFFAILYALAYSTVALFLAAFIFERREIN